MFAPGTVPVFGTAQFRTTAHSEPGTMKESHGAVHGQQAPRIAFQSTLVVVEYRNACVDRHKHRAKEFYVTLVVAA